MNVQRCGPTDFRTPRPDFGRLWDRAAGTRRNPSGSPTEECWNPRPSRGFEQGIFRGISDPTGIDGNLATTPGFLDVTTADGDGWDLHLADGAVTVDAGNPSILDPDGSPSDMGAYGGPAADSWDLDRDGYPEWWLPGPYDPVTSPGLDCDDRDPEQYPGAGC